MALANRLEPARAEFQEIIQNYLDYWLAFLQATHVRRKVTNDLESLNATIRFGQQERTTRLLAAGLLALVFPYLLPNPDRSWLKLYEIAIRQTPKGSAKLALLHYQYACLKWQTGSYRGAVESFSRSSQLAKNKRMFLLARTGLALSFWSLKDYKNAETQATRLIKLTARKAKLRHLNNQMHLLLGLLSFSSKRYAEALDNSKGIPIAAAGNELKTHVFLKIGLCYQAMGNLKRALIEYNRAAKATQLLPDNIKKLARIEILRASIHFQNRKSNVSFRLTPALAALSRAAEAFEGDSSAARAVLENFMGRVYTRTGNIKRGLAYLNSALDLSEKAENSSLFADTFDAIGVVEQKRPSRASSRI